MEAIINHYIQQYGQVKPHLLGADVPWLVALREQAIAQFAKQGLPHQRLEDWRYTPINPLLKQTFSVDTKHEIAATPYEQIKPFLLSDTLNLIFIDGVFVAEYSSQAIAPTNCILSNLGHALTHYPDQLAKYISPAITSGLHGFSSLNASLMNDGACIILPPDCQIAKPIQILYVQTKPLQSYQLCNVIVVGEHSAATVIEHYIGLTDNNYFTNTATYAFVQANARLNYFKLQEESSQASHIGFTKIQQHQHSSVATHYYAMGGLLTRSDIHIALQGIAATCNSYGIYRCQHNQLLDQHTRIDHLVPSCRSREIYKGILDHQARGVFNGKIIVHSEAQQSDAHLANHNILLSNQAEIDTKPELEIYADDVKCTHGATVGQLSQDALFYLRSRGLDNKTARHLLLYAFVAEMLELIEISAVKIYLQQRLFPAILQEMQ